MKLMHRKRSIAVVLGILLLGWITVSLSSHPVSNPPVTGEIQLPPAIKELLETSCYDCHSNETTLNWYDRLPIVSSVIAGHVTEARKHLNFSHWDSLSPADQKSTLLEVFNMIRLGKMPLPAYTALHPATKVNEKQLAVFQHYLDSLLMPTARNSAPATGQTISPAHAPVAPNGIVYSAEYRNWQVLSTTSRFDNGTMRVMYANPVAMQALKNNTINPWPDGSIIVKVVWEKLTDAEGNTRPGKFVNIQYMVRDKQKYKDTEGWGFAKFDTPELKPYGTVASTQKCISCHRMVKETGFVFDLSTK